MYYNQTILNSDRYPLYITIIKSDNNMTTEALKHYKGEESTGATLHASPSSPTPCRWPKGPRAGHEPRSPRSESLPVTCTARCPQSSIDRPRGGEEAELLRGSRITFVSLFLSISFSLSHSRSRIHASRRNDSPAR